MPNLTETRLTSRMGRLSPWVIGLAIFGNYLLLGSRTTLWDRDEPRFARPAVEMLESRNYLVITFNDETWPDKPVLTYWLMALAIRVLGPTEIACRLFGIFGTALTCAATFYIGYRPLGRRAGLWAMLILASTLQMLVIGSAATSDAVLLPFTIGAMAVFAHMKQTEVRLSHVVLLGVAMGFGMLTKGPMGLMPALAIVVYVLLEGKSRGTWLTSFAPVVAGVAIGAIIFCAWALPANRATGGEFLRVFVGRHVVGRALRPMEHHGGNPLLYLGYYIPVVIGGFFPWSLHLPGALSALAGARVGGTIGRRFFLAWIVPPFVLMSLAATKLPHYIVFIWPALALIVGGALAAAQADTLTQRDRKWLRGGVWFLGPLAAVIGLGLVVGPWFVPLPGLRGWGAAAGMVVLAMAAVAIREHLADRPQNSALALIAGMIVFQIPLQCGVLPAVEQIKISPALAREVNARTAPNVPVAIFKYGEPTLNFYVGRHVEPLGSQEAVLGWAGQPGPRVLVVPRNRLDEIQRRFGALPMEEIASVKGFNYSKGIELDVVALFHDKEE